MGSANIANCSGISFAITFGVISPKISTTTVITMVESDTPAFPKTRVKSTVAIEAAAIFTILLPIRIVDKIWSNFSENNNTFSAFLFPLEAILLSLIALKEENAVSVAEKNAENSVNAANIMMIIIL